MWEEVRIVACYHLRIKTDKKPGGMKVSAIEHVDYLHREGKYRDVDARTELSTGPRDFKNLITGDHPILPLPKKRVLLYKSPFGKIVLDKDGIRVNRYASPDTTAIALAVAQKLFGDEVSVRGNAKFQASCLAASCELSMDVHFREDEMEQRRKEMKEEQSAYERRRSAEGGAFCAGGSSGGDAGCGRRALIERHKHRAPINTQRGATGHLVADAHERTLFTLAQARSRMSLLSPRDVDAHRQGSRVSVPRAVRDQLLDSGRRSDAYLDLRRVFSVRRSENVKATAEQILSILQKGVDGDFAFAHVQYINREAAFAMRGGCMATGHHLPHWAENSPLKFFHAADRYERVNGERYKEIVFSLPNELTLEKNREILDAFLARYMQNHYYAWAIHEKVGAMSDGVRHPHVHLMFSTREIDDVERRQERTPELFFHRANKKHPERGGCPKSRRWTGANRSQFLFEMREAFARMQNEVFAKYHIPAHVDHRSLAVQKMAAELRGDIVLAELLDRMPETAVTPSAILREDPVVRQQKALREAQRKRLDKITARELAQDEAREKRVTDAMDAAVNAQEELREELLSTEADAENATLSALLQKMERVRRDMDVASAAVLWGRQALEEAQLDFLGDEGREAWMVMTSLQRELAQAQDFEDTLYRPLPEGASIEDEAVRSELQLAMIQRIADLEKRCDVAEKAFAPFREKLERPGTHKQIQYRLHMYLFQNEVAKARLEKCVDAFVDAVQNARVRVKMMSAQSGIPSTAPRPHTQPAQKNTLRDPAVAALIAKDEEEERDGTWALIAEMEKDEMQSDR